MTLISYAKIREELHKNPEFVREYEALAEEFEIADALIGARKNAKMTQHEVAEKMGTTQSAVARMESGKSVSLKSIRKYAQATNSRITLTIG
ncbi:MAG: XRE family transcriptional regulator [Synergistales bacterium]|nr:XRE family transcriptional regulator [Synergistales bacterium]